MAYFISTVRYDKTMDNGQIKTVNEQYLSDALTVTEAEAKTTEHVSPFISGEFTIPSVKKSRIQEILGEASGDYFWVCSVAFITLDERSGIEKRSVTPVLVQADSFDDAYRKFLKGMEGTLADFELESVKLSKIVELV